MSSTTSSSFLDLYARTSAFFVDRMCCVSAQDTVNDAVEEFDTASIYAEVEDSVVSHKEGRPSHDHHTREGGLHVPLNIFSSSLDEEDERHHIMKKDVSKRDPAAGSHIVTSSTKLFNSSSSPGRTTMDNDAMPKSPVVSLAETATTATMSLNTRSDHDEMSSSYECDVFSTASTEIISHQRGRVRSFPSPHHYNIKPASSVDHRERRRQQHLYPIKPVVIDELSTRSEKYISRKQQEGLVLPDLRVRHFGRVTLEDNWTC